MENLLTILFWIFVAFLIYRFIIRNKNKQKEKASKATSISFEERTKQEVQKIKEIIETPFEDADENSEPFFMVFDLETTGFLPDHNDFKIHEDFPYPVQIAWSIFDFEGKLIKNKSYIIKQDIKIPEDASNVHGITTEIMNQKGEDPHIVYQDFVESLKLVKYLIAHNMEYDDLVLKSDFYRKGLKISQLSKKRICTMKKFKNFCAIPFPYKSGNKYPKLSELVVCTFSSFLDPVKTKINGTHNASHDVLLTAKCFFELLHKYEEIRIEKN